MLNKEQDQSLAEALKEPIAIIGMACQFPGIAVDIEDVDSLNAMLLKGLSPIREIPADRWDLNEYYDADRAKEDKTVSRKGGFLNNIHLFDAAFFKISAVEAKQMDPQHRLFLEVAVRALNQANITLASLKGSNTGVYCGLSTSDYNQLNYKDNIQFNAYTAIGVAPSAASGRLAHFLDLKGPCLAIDTACSSSFSALHQATTALRTKQCDLAIVGGVHLNLCPENFISLSKAKMLSAMGQCSSFDVNADGYVRSEGCAVVIVQRLSEALKNNNTIYGVLNSIVMNQDGDGHGLIAPNLEAQVALHHAALREAQIGASDIDYIEAHGTGTILGDAIEFQAIQQVHQGYHQDKPLIIGALKSALGHTVSSSGLASILKVIGTFNNELIPPNLHYSTPNKSIKPTAIPALFPTEVKPFPRDKNKKRRVQIANFSFSGTNVSAVLEEGPQPRVINTPSDESQLKCFVVSANSEYSLRQLLAHYCSYLSNSSDCLEDICFTLMNCRDHYRYRCAILTKDKKTLIHLIKTGEYSIHKVTINAEAQKTAMNVKALYKAYLSGAAIKLDENEIAFNKVNLPLYCFERKNYWHEVRNKNKPITESKGTILNNEPIAIIGMSCRFPKAASVAEFLTLLQNGDSGMTDIPLERWDNEQFFDKDVDALGKLYIRQLGLVEDIKRFDAEFFNISPREAKFMSPPIRLFMECSYHALEDANLALDQVKDSKTGVFVGVGTDEYLRLLLSQGMSLEEHNIYVTTGNVHNAVAGRVAYSFDFHGPTQAVDTACSSSMTAIHNACLSLQSGDCDLALAGGVNVILLPNSSIALSKAKMLSPESRCKTFSEDADGYARSEGCGIIVLKRLSTALKDNDTILAVIKGSAVNNDGKSGGFTVPNGLAQEEVIRAALAKAHLSPAEVDCIEAHGTGTPLADPIEANTLMNIFSDSHSKEHPLYLSSVKTNIGHTESASGVAGVIKAVLSLKEKQLFKHLNFKSLNPEIELRNTIIPLQTLDWHKAQGLRTIGVSSFGFSGANAHAIIQELPQNPTASMTLPEHGLLLLSAKSKSSLELLLERYQHFLVNTEEAWADVCYTAATCRSHFLFRVAILASSTKEAALAIKEQRYTLHEIKKEQETRHNFATLEMAQEAYLQGNKVDWKAFYSALGYSFAKVHLPLYAFSGKEHWYDAEGKITDSPLPKDWCYQLQWQAQPCDKDNAKIPGKNWLLLGATYLKEALTKQGFSVFLEKDSYPLETLDGVVFAMALDGEYLTELDDLLEFQKNIIKTLLHWVKTLSQGNASVQLIVLTSKGIAELITDKINHCDASVVGFCKTLAQELPQYQTILIDVDNADDDCCTAAVINEIKYNYGPSYEHIVAYRENKRYISRLKKIALSEIKYSLYGKGRYLITGASGGLGLVTAKALLSAGANELILVARTIDREEFTKTLSTLQSSYPGRIINAVSLDITDKNKLATLLAHWNKDGLLKGIIHAAGTAIKAPLTEHQDEDVDCLFAAKVKGAWYLHELTKNYKLDFFILYSSVASVFGSNRESVYSGANSCLDLLIAARCRSGLVGTSVQWGPWGEAGMAQRRSRDPNLKQALISNEQGHHFIKMVLNTPLPELTIISPQYLQFMLDFVPQPLPLFYKELEHDLIHRELTQEQDLTGWLNDYLELSAEQRFIACKKMVTELCKTILEMPPSDDLEEDEGFFELGFDSLMVAELASELKKRLEPALKIMVNIGFNYPTITKLARYLETELSGGLTHQTSVTERIDLDDIAVIGMSCSLPGAPDIVAFQQLLHDGVNAIQDIPKTRWDNSLYYDADPNAPGKSYVNKLGLVEHIKGFDAAFFGISPREAQFMDPQQRLFLECCYTAIEQANYPIAELNGSLTGVFAGVGPNEYSQLGKSDYSNEESSLYSVTGNVLNLISGRVAYAFDLKGPSLSVDTACSSSLVAIHYACQSLKNYEVDYALAGGVNSLLLPGGNVLLSKARALSPEGQCKSFDAAADGYVRAEGCGVLLLKRLNDALRDKDNILAVIKASAVNNDGKTVGLTVPNGKSQEEVMLKALKQAHVGHADVSYIEAHGTGTPLGDPIEVHAINQIYGVGRTKNNPLYIGTVKTNIGHLESASGIAGVIKTIIGLQNKKIYKLLNFNKLNPDIQLNQTRLPLHTTDWQTSTALRTAGINAFGFSGTNAHLIIQEHVASVTSRPKQYPGIYLLVLSAKSKVSLDLLVSRYQEYLAKTADDFADICFTAATCRAHYTYRLVVAAGSKEEARQYLMNGDFALSYGEDNTHNVNNPTLQSLLLAYLKSKDVDWHSFYKSIDEDFNKVLLPTYVFDRMEFWPSKKTTPSVLNQSVAKQSYNPYHVSQKATLLSILNTQTAEERTRTIEQLVRTICAQVLKMDKEQIALEADLFSLGFDSLMAVELRSRLHDKLNCPALSIAMEYFLNNPRIEKIAVEVMRELTPLLENPGLVPDLATPIINQISVCEFQYNFWVLNQFNYSFNLGTQFHLKGPLNKEYFAQAFAEVIKNRGAFWIDFSKQTLLQSMMPRGDFKVIYKECKEEEECNLHRQFMSHIGQFIPLNQQPLIRVYLYKINPSLHEIHLIIPHIIAEGRSCDLILEQFKHNYELLIAGKKLPVLAEENNYFQYVQYNNYHYANHLKEKIKFWYEYNADMSHLYLGAHRHLRDAAAPQDRYLFHYPLPTPLMESFIAWHSTNNLNISTGLIALCPIVFYLMSGQSKLPVTLIHTGREGSQYQTSVGLFAEYKRINSIINENNQYSDTIAFIEEQFLKTAPFQKCSYFIKDKNILGERLSFFAWIVTRWTKWTSSQIFKNSGLDKAIIKLYQRYLGKLTYIRLVNLTKIKLNRWFNWSIPIQKPQPLHVLISITPSFFAKAAEEMQIGNLQCHYPNHFAYADIPIGNRTLWIYFSKDQQGIHQLSINGPLTEACRDEIASRFVHIMESVLENERLKIGEMN